MGEPDVKIPKEIKGYQIVQELGHGAFSKVCKAHHTLSKQDFACKIFPKSNLTDQGDMERFQREINAMAYLRHENLVALHDFFWDDLNFYLIMDLCPGGELFDYIVDHDKLDEPVAAYLFKQIASAIAYCHSLGVAHRDLKPENVLIDQFPRVKVSDFGLCGYIQNQRLMKTFCGSPCYCSPECLCRVQYDGRLSDVWSLGVILFAMVTGEHPWNITNTSIMLRQILRGAYTVPSYVSKNCKDLITKMMQVNPKDRIEIDNILKHPWLQLANKANVPKLASAKPPVLEGLPPLQGLSLEEISQASAQDSQRSEVGIISPFDDPDHSTDGTVGLPRLCIRSQSVEIIRANQASSATRLVQKDSEKGRRRFQAAGAGLSMATRQKSAANLLQAPRAKKVLPMMTINEDE